MRVVGVDPGKTTGIAVFVDGIFVEGTELAVEDIGSIWDYEPDQIVMEDFFLTTRHRGAGGVDYKTPLAVIGVVDHLARGRTPVAKQPPSVLGSRLYEISRGLSTSPHIRSAATHALSWIVHHCPDLAAGILRQLS